MLKSEINSASFRKNNENSDYYCNTPLLFTPKLNLHKTTSSMLIAQKLTNRNSSMAHKKTDSIEINLSLNDPLDLEKMKQIFHKKKEARQPQEIKILAKSFEVIDLFKEIKVGIDPLLYQRLFKELIYEEFPANEFIFKVNDPPDKIYIILSGEVYILAAK